jgi:hypothetical protein
MTTPPQRLHVLRYDARPVCGAWMPNAKEPCARRAGHLTGHRSRYALDNNRDARWFGVDRERVAS